MFVNVYEVGLAKITIFALRNQMQKTVLYLHMSGGQLYEQRRGSLQPTNDLWLHFGHALIVNVTWPYAWWCSPMANETSRLGTVFCIWLCNINIVIRAGSIILTTTWGKMNKGLGQSAITMRGVSALSFSVLWLCWLGYRNKKKNYDTYPCWTCRRRQPTEYELTCLSKSDKISI